MQLGSALPFHRRDLGKFVRPSREAIWRCRARHSPPMPCLKVVPAFPASHRIGYSANHKYGLNSLACALWLRLDATGGAMRTFLIKVVVLTLLSVSLGGCAAALVGGLIYKSTKSNEEKANFVT